MAPRRSASAVGIARGTPEAVLRPGGGLVDRSEAVLAIDEQILLAALECFVEKGYHGTSVRDIAKRANISVPGLYHHFPSKMVLLERLMEQTMDALIAQTERALSGARMDPIDRFCAVLTAHVRFHCERPEESFVGNSELRSLAGELRQTIMEKRDRQQGFFDQVVKEGIEAGVFEPENEHMPALALASMCTAVSMWYRRDGPLAPEDIVSIYRDLGLQMMGSRAELTDDAAL
jgi:AcrR family transcriptional regulator